MLKVNHDRKDLVLEYIYEFINQVASSAKGKVILIILSGGCVDLSTDLLNNTLIDAILWAGYGGTHGGQGVIDVIFGMFAPTGLTTQIGIKMNIS